MTIQGILLRIRNFYLRKSAKRRKKDLLFDDFTIISNNCWSGLICESYNIPKTSPTTGLYFMAEEYIKFLGNLKHYIQECKIKFIPPEMSKHRDFYAQDKSFGAYPIAVIDDVEIAMLHYHSEKEAQEKWERRCQRVNWDKLVIKMNDQNECNEELVRKFCELDFENKLFFTVNKDWQFSDCVKVFKNRKKKHINGLKEPFGKGYNGVNITEFLNLL